MSVVRVVALSVMLLAVGGCFISSPVTHARLTNNSSEAVTLVLLGVDDEPTEYPANAGLQIEHGAGQVIEGSRTCVGDGYVLAEAATGRVLVTSSEPVCGNTLITVNEDLSVAGD